MDTTTFTVTRTSPTTSTQRHLENGPRICKELGILLIQQTLALGDNPRVGGALVLNTRIEQKQLYRGQHIMAQA